MKPTMSGKNLYPREYHYFPEFQSMDMSLMDADFIVAVQRFRAICDIPMMASPAEGAFYRTDPQCYSSRHCAIERLSDAGDFFPQKERVLECWVSALQWHAFGGIGLYLDTQYNGKPHPMIHLDCRLVDRLGKSLWIRDKGVYHGQKSKEFWRLVSKLRDMI